MGAASTASAGPVFGMGVSVPPTVVVGSTGDLATLRIQNISFSDSGEAGFEDDSYALDDITYVPSCGTQLPVADCPIGAKDPGVLVPSPLVATGRAGTACEETRTFSITRGRPAGGWQVAGPPGRHDNARGRDRRARDAPVRHRLHDQRGQVADGGLGHDRGWASDRSQGIRDRTRRRPRGGEPRRGRSRHGHDRDAVAPAVPTLATVRRRTSSWAPGSSSTTPTLTGLVGPIESQDSVEFRLYRGADCDALNLVLTRTDTTLSSTGRSPSPPPTPARPSIRRGRGSTAGGRSTAATPTTPRSRGRATPRTRTPSSRRRHRRSRRSRRPTSCWAPGSSPTTRPSAGSSSPIAAQDEVVFRLYRGADCADANVILTRTMPR